MSIGQDPYKVWDGTAFRFTLKKLCDIVYGEENYTIPKAFASVSEQTIARVAADNMVVKSGLRVVFDLSWNVPAEESYGKVKTFLESGIIVFTNRDFFDDGGKKYPVMKVDDVWEAWIALGRYVKGVFPMPTIAITGSAGKTTTTMFAECVFNERYKTFVSGLDGRNFNTTLQIVNQWILRIDPSYTIHVQECGAETIDLVKSSARVIDADGFGITNIDTSQHIATYETAENLIADKTSFDRVRNENTYGIINIDDEILRNHPFESPLITFAIEDESADYVGKNIVQNGELLEFDVYSKTEDPVHIKIHIIGKHNVYNALLVFAFAKKFGLSNEEIQRGFLNYESVGIRQYLRRVGGRLLYMDAYNASVESTQLSIKALEELIVPEGGRRIAVIGERKTSNEETYEINYNLGRELAKYKGIDEFIIVGEDTACITGKPETIDPQNAKRYSHVVFDGARSAVEEGTKLSFANNLKELAAMLNYQTRPGDAILFKGRYHLSLWAIADMAFGTNYTKAPALIPLNVKRARVASKVAAGDNYACFGGVSLTTLVNGFDTTKLVCPASVNSVPVVRIDEEAFANRSQLNMFVFGSHTKAIGDHSFLNCTNLEYIELPLDCLYVGIGSFEGCKKMVSASMPGVSHISKKAFADCCNLKKVFLTEKCATIEADAFRNCSELKIYAPKDSYAEKWAAENNIPFEAIDSEEEISKLAKNGTRNKSSVYALEKFDAVPEKATDESENAVTKLSVIFAGDIMVHDDQLAACHDTTTDMYYFDKLFTNTSKHIKAADLAVGNVETVFGHGAYTGFPKFNTPDDLAGALARAGFDVSASANNHIFDMKYAGIIRTKRILQDHGIAVAGIRMSENDKSYVVVERNGVKIALVNYTYRTQSVNGRKTINTHVMDAASVKSVNTFCFETLDKDLLNIRNEINCARADGADVVLVYYHWGCEYERYSNTLQKYIAYKTAEMGVDAIIGSHAHVLQEISSVCVTVDGKEKTVPVAYGMGNYCWGARLPRTGRETVHDGVLAKLNIAFDKQNKNVESVETEYLPLHIKTEYIADHFDVNVLSLSDMSEEETEAFNLRSSRTVAEITKEIDDTINGRLHDVKSEIFFDNVVEVPLGTPLNVKNILFEDREDIVMFCSENSPVAAVLQTGVVIPNSPGFAGMTATTENGEELCFVVKVTGSGKNPLPVIVNKFNSVPDIYRPASMVTGASYGLGAAIYLELNTAKAWSAMKAAAAVEGVHLRCVGGYRTNEGQLKKIVEYAEVFGMPAAQKRFMPMGYSEHNLGIAVDVTNVEAGEEKCDRATAYAWISKNAHRFGFIVRSSTRVLHKHLTFIGDPAAAKLLSEEKNPTITRYVGLNAKYRKQLRGNEKWKRTYLSANDRSTDIADWTKLTLARICRLIGVALPVAYRDIQNRIVPCITMSDLNVVPGSVYFYDKTLKNAMQKCRNALRHGAVLAITDTTITDEQGNLLPQIKVKNSFDACVAVGRHLCNVNKAKVIAIEEKIDRRILRNILFEVLSPSYNVHKNALSVDNRINTLATIQQLTPEHDIYLQNIRGSYPGYISKSAEMLSPDMAVITPVSGNFPAAYNTKQAYAKDYESLAKKTLDAEGIIFVDIDDPLMQKFLSSENAVTYSKKNNNADYYLRSQNTADGFVEFTVIRKSDEQEFVQRLPEVYQKSPSYAVAAVAVSDMLSGN